MVLSSKQITPEEIARTEVLLLKAIRAGVCLHKNLVLEVATVRYHSGVSRKQAVKRGLQALKAKGLAEARGSKWYPLGMPEKSASPACNFGISPAAVCPGMGKLR